MSESHPWNLNLGRHPSPDEVSFDLERTLSSVVSLQSRVPDDAFTAPILGTEREGQGVVVEGYVENGVLRAEEVLAKHDENYMPPEVAKALKKSGQWRDTPKATGESQ